MRSSSRKPLLPDTNVLVYETVEDSSHHIEAAELIDSAGEILVVPIVLHEYMWVMIRKLGVPAGFVAAKISEYLGDPRTRYVAEPLGVINKALGLLEKGYMQPRELNDAIILATAIQYNAVLATFDQRLRRKAKQLGVPVKP